MIVSLVHDLGVKCFSLSWIRDLEILLDDGSPDALPAQDRSDSAAPKKLKRARLQINPPANRSENPLRDQDHKILSQFSRPETNSSSGSNTRTEASGAPK